MKCHPITSNIIRSLNITKEKFEYLAFAFISDHLQKKNLTNDLQV